MYIKMTNRPKLEGIVSNFNSLFHFTNASQILFQIKNVIINCLPFKCEYNNCEIISENNKSGI